MATLDTNPQPQSHRTRLVFLGAVALLAPVSYLAGRYAVSAHVPQPWTFISIGASMLGLGALMGIPLGLFFGSLRSQTGPIIRHYHPSFIRQQDKILEQLRTELSYARDQWRERAGDSISTTAIRYDLSFWNAAKASGQLFVMQEPALLSTIAKAYHWLEEANRIEQLAFEANYAPASDNQNATTHLIAQARLLDGAVSSNLDLAIIAIDGQLGVDRATPPGQEPEPAVAHTELTV
jgi:hypothetical protein